MHGLVKHVLLFAGYGAVGGGVILITIYMAMLEARPELEPWHRARLQGEFTTSDSSRITSLADYLALEHELFETVDAEIYEPAASRPQPPWFRFASGSRADPRRHQPNWNRTQMFLHPNARGAALLLHGLSDSPYSMRSLSRLCQEQGLSVLALRLPGHGTIPSALLTTDYRDWMAAVRLGMRHLQQTHPGQPLFMAGYSTGGALAVEYAAARHLDPTLPAVGGIILISPAIGVSPLAALAPLQSGLAGLPGLAKTAWTDIQPEYDPYKFNSFTVNAGDQVYRLTRHVSSQLELAFSSSGGRGMPRILAFQSVADATISAPAVLDTLFMRLAPEGHELVAFDINRKANVAPLFATPIADIRQRLLTGPALPVDVTLVTNAHEGTNEIMAVHRPAEGTEATTEALSLKWPASVYSLSHVALPFPPDDPIYGADAPAGSETIFLGRLDLRGERGLLVLPAGNLLRLRHNPFFPYIERRLKEFLGSAQGAGIPCRSRRHGQRECAGPRADTFSTRD